VHSDRARKLAFVCTSFIAFAVLLALALQYDFSVQVVRV
jgi:hypothetical protein